MAYCAVMLFDVIATIYCNKFEYREVMNMIKALAIIGIIGGMLCAVADLLLDLKGVDNQKLGKMRVIDSKWREMSHGRFVWSDIIALPLWGIILNPLVFQLIGLLFRATGLKIFIDAPSCCAASLGLAMYGVLALMLI